jgi:Amidohydrolase family
MKTFIILLLLSSPAFAQDLLIKSATIIDGTGATAALVADVEIVNGRIARLAPNLKSKVTPVIEARGLYLMPGLIDAHTHLRSVPGSEFRHDSKEEIKKEQSEQLKAYIAAGVTTVLDAAAPESLVREAKELSEKDVAPRILTLAPFLTPEGGYFASAEDRGELYKDLWPPIHDTAAIASEMAAAKPLNPLGVKVTFEKGFGQFDVWPVFNEAQRKIIVSEAAKNNLPIFVHSMSADEHRLALTLKPYAFMHAGFDKKPADPKLVQQIKDSGAYVVTTLAVDKMILLMWHADAFEDPLLKLLVPSNQIKTGSDSKIRDEVIKRVVIDSKPSWAPKFAAALRSSQFFNEHIVNDQLANSSNAVNMMYKLGVPLVMGSDSGNWPLWTTFFHGYGTILEIEALEQAGLPPKEIIVAATSRAAKMLKIDDQVGSVSVGKIADLIILDHNPLDDASAIRKLSWVVKCGVAKSPSDWMK